MVIFCRAVAVFIIIIIITIIAVTVHIIITIIVIFPQCRSRSGGDYCRRSGRGVLCVVCA